VDATLRKATVRSPSALPSASPGDARRHRTRAPPRAHITRLVMDRATGRQCASGTARCGRARTQVRYEGCTHWRRHAPHQHQIRAGHAPPQAQALVNLRGKGPDAGAREAGRARREARPVPTIGAGQGSRNCPPSLPAPCPPKPPPPSTMLVSVLQALPPRRPPAAALRARPCGNACVCLVVVGSPALQVPARHVRPYLCCVPRRCQPRGPTTLGCTVPGHACVCARAAQTSISRRGKRLLSSVAAAKAKSGDSVRGCVARGGFSASCGLHVEPCWWCSFFFGGTPLLRWRHVGRALPWAGPSAVRLLGTPLAFCSGLRCCARGAGGWGGGWECSLCLCRRAAVCLRPGTAVSWRRGWFALPPLPLPPAHPTSPPPTDRTRARCLRLTFNWRAFVWRAHVCVCARAGLQLLKKRFAEVLPAVQGSVKELLAAHKDVPIHSVTVDQCVGGGRGIPCILWETSLLNEKTVCVCWEGGGGGWRCSAHAAPWPVLDSRVSQHTILLLWLGRVAASQWSGLLRCAFAGCPCGARSPHHGSPGRKGLRFV
jgi:hypothetical protein